jgi:hypothetical protein
MIARSIVGDFWPVRSVCPTPLSTAIASLPS